MSKSLEVGKAYRIGKSILLIRGFGVTAWGTEYVEYEDVTKKQSRGKLERWPRGILERDVICEAPEYAND